MEEQQDIMVMLQQYIKKFTEELNEIRRREKTRS